ncbi:hypothetical protein RJ641_026496 [Dillenia turbinata]|uniref:Uncharacterized protein n=1 Tax=Dillenia turbinata TaxID=194707 RepID=A0AAN8W918_9MAGN
MESRVSIAYHFGLLIDRGRDLARKGKDDYLTGEVVPPKAGDSKFKTWKDLDSGRMIGNAMRNHAMALSSRSS